MENDVILQEQTAVERAVSEIFNLFTKVHCPIIGLAQKPYWEMGSSESLAFVANGALHLNYDLVVQAPALRKKDMETVWIREVDSKGQPVNEVLIGPLTYGQVRMSLFPDKFAKLREQLQAMGHLADFTDAEIRSAIADAIATHFVDSEIGRHPSSWLHDTDSLCASIIRRGIVSHFVCAAISSKERISSGVWTRFENDPDVTGQNDTPAKRWLRRAGHALVEPVITTHGLQGIQSLIKSNLVGGGKEIAKLPSYIDGVLARLDETSPY